jgi:hypothetical protein
VSNADFTEELIMKTLVVATGLVAVCGGLAAAQNPNPPSTQTPSTQPPTASSPATRPAPNTAANRSVTVTMTGCLYNERDVPGRTPNVAEKAGVLEDYILAEARMANTAAAADHGGAAPATATSTGNNTATRSGSEATRATGNSTTSTEGHTSTSTQAGASSSGADRAAAATGRTQGSTAPATQAVTAGTMYKVEGVPDEQLRALVGKRVEVMGRIDAEGNTAGARPNRNPVSPDKVDLPEFEASSIRAASGGAACAAKPAATPVTPR